jgi:hypothetical protein
MAETIKYQVGNPEALGVYAVRVPDEEALGLWKDLFLIWHNNNWWYPFSDVKYRGPVDYFIGPLQRRMPPQMKQEQT